MTFAHHQIARRLFASSTLALAVTAATAVAQPAMAQGADADASASNDDGQLPTIIVTANRREENLQDVPISAGTLDAARVSTIFATGADTTALAGKVPGLNVESSNGRVAPRFYIRGLGNTDFDLAASQPVSVILDDIVLENTTLKSFPLFDVERIEVLRGPQGTLFGRNTPAGIVKIDTVKPGNQTDVRAYGSFGSYSTYTIGGAVGVPIVEDTLALRFSGQVQGRSNWIDNSFTNEDDALGGYLDFAMRGQLLLTPGDRFSALATAQYRSLDGSSTLFRANAVGPGNNKLNDNYDRKTVAFDGGNGNVADYQVFGSSLKMAYEFDAATLTSITGYYESEGSSRGDIDGGNLVTGPGFIPFASDTRDSIDLDQFTQEVRLASPDSGMFTWQLGAFYFDSDFDVTTVGYDFPPSTTVNHTNESWAVFGQGTYELTPGVKLTAGLRYTDDRKDFFVRSNPAAPQRRSVQDDRLSWDVALQAEVALDASVYARVASGFRAPTIQGRDVAFFAAPSIATSEKIMSYEAGFKTELANRRVRLNGAVYYYTVEDPQFTAVGGAGNLVQLVNANKGEAFGFEVDSAFQITPEFRVTLGVAYADTRIKDSNLAVGICAQCTVTDPTVTIGGNTRALVDGNPFPNAPEWSGDLTARYGLPVGDDGEFFIFTDWVLLGDTNVLLYESREFNLGTRIEGGLKVGYAGDNGRWEIAAFARNITDEDNIQGAIDFNNNTVFVNEPRIIGVSGSFRY